MSTSNYLLQRAVKHRRPHRARDKCVLAGEERQLWSAAEQGR
jgi:hypothetical protein